MKTKKHKNPKSYNASEKDVKVSDDPSENSVQEKLIDKSEDSIPRADLEKFENRRSESSKGLNKKKALCIATLLILGGVPLIVASALTSYYSYYALQNLMKPTGCTSSTPEEDLRDKAMIRNLSKNRTAINKRSILGKDTEPSSKTVNESQDLKNCANVHPKLHRFIGRKVSDFFTRVVPNIFRSDGAHVCDPGLDKESGHNSRREYKLLVEYTPRGGEEACDMKTNLLSCHRDIEVRCARLKDFPSFHDNFERSDGTKGRNYCVLPPTHTIPTTLLCSSAERCMANSAYTKFGGTCRQIWDD